MSDQEQYGVGLNFHLDGHVVRELQQLAGIFDHIHKASNVASKAAHQEQSTVIKGRKEEAALARIAASEAASTARIRTKGELDIAKLKAKNAADSIAFTQKAERAILATQQKQIQGEKALMAQVERISGIRSRNARSDENAVTRLRGLESQRAERAIIAEERINNERRRGLILQERLAKMQARPVKLTHDQQRVTNVQGRIKALKPAAGDMIGYSQQVATGGFGLVKGILDIGKNKAVTRLQHEQMAIQGLGLSPKDQAQLVRGSEWVSHNIKGLDKAQGIEVTKDLFNVLGNAKESTDPRLMAAVGQMMIQNKVKYHMSNMQVQKALMAADQMIQVTPAMKKLDPKSHAYQEAITEQILGNLNTVQKGISSSGGRVLPSEQQNMLTYAGSARFGLSNSGLLDLTGLVREKKGARVGTLLNAFNDQVVNLHGTDTMIGNIKSAGLMTPNSHYAYLKTKKGKLTNKIDKKHSHLELIDRQMAIADPKAWFDKYVMPKVDKFKTNDQKLNFLNGLGGRKTTKDWLTSLYFQHETLTREGNAAKKAHGLQAGYDDINGSYGLAQKHLEAAQNKLIQAVSPAAMEASARGLTALASSIEALTGAIEKHPRATKIGIQGGLIGGTAVGIGATAVAAKFGWNTYKAMSTIASGGAGAAGEAAAGNAAGAAVGKAAGSSAAKLMAVRFLAMLPMVLGTAAVAAGGLAIGLAIGSAIRSGLERSSWFQNVDQKFQEWLAGKMMEGGPSDHPFTMEDVSKLNALRKDNHLRNVYSGHYKKEPGEQVPWVLNFQSPPAGADIKPQAKAAGKMVERKIIQAHKQQGTIKNRRHSGPATVH